MHRFCTKNHSKARDKWHRINSIPFSHSNSLEKTTNTCLHDITRYAPETHVTASGIEPHMIHSSLKRKHDDGTAANCAYEGRCYI